MAGINVEYINPFISAAQTVLKDFSQIESSMGKPYLKQATYEGDILAVIIGITGVLRGQVILTMETETACYIASKMMMGMPVPELNDMAKSAVSEMSNMILGNAATIFSTKNIALDITPPTITLGNNLSFSVSDSKTICVPLTFNNYTLEINIAIKEA
jgi:chemotaxis protein CheX